MKAQENNFIIQLDLHHEDGRRRCECHALPLLIGRDPACGLVIRTWRVARQHARLILRQDEIWVQDLGSLLGTLVNGVRVAEYGPLREHDELLIGPCLIRLKPALPVPERTQGPESAGQPPEGVSVPACTEAARPDTDGACDDPCDGPPPASDASMRPAPSLVGYASGTRRRLHDRLISALELRRRDISSMSDSALRAQAAELLAGLIAAEEQALTAPERDRLVKELVSEAVGLGPLEPLLADPGVSEIMVNRHDEIYVERAGRLQRDASCFSSEQAVLSVIERIVAPLGRRIDDSSPMVDARLPDGSRVNAVIAPVALRGASLTIRKFPVRRLTMGDLLMAGSLSEAMACFLACCVRRRKNVVVSGGTGTGKTSLLNILSNAIPENERILTIEDAAELRLHHGHLVSLEARPANLEGQGRIEIRDLVRNALRMRPDRIVVGECRGPEAFDMLAAMNTGHEGSLTTLHANSPRDALGRLETMILMASMDLPLPAVREHIASSIDILIQLLRAGDGRRLVSAIVQVTGMEGGRIQLQELFLGQAGPPAVFSGCGLLPDGFEDAPELDTAWFSGQSICSDLHHGTFGGDQPGFGAQAC